MAACGGHARSLSGSLTLTDGGSSDQLAMARVMVTMAAKSSADTARRVTAGRERWAGRSYQGGKRPYGYRPDPDAPEHRKTLIIVPAEAEVIRAAAGDILKRGISLKAIARDLRDRREPTVTGTQWTASTLRDILAKPAVAGIAVHTRIVKDEETGQERKVTSEHPGAWPAILKLKQWEQLRHLFDSRKTGTSPEPRWLVSGYATWGRAARRSNAPGRPPAAPTPAPPTGTFAGSPLPWMSTSPGTSSSGCRSPTRLWCCSRRPGPGSTPGRCAPRRGGWTPRRSG